MTIRSIRSVCVYLGAATGVDRVYLDAAELLGKSLATAHVDIIYGGSSSGTMGALASAALAAGGRVHGVRPRVGVGLEPEHCGLTSMLHTDDLGSRKRLMWARAGAIVVLPGGSGTLDELLEAITQKRLGVHELPIIIANVAHYFDLLFDFLKHGEHERFVSSSQTLLWLEVPDIGAVMRFLSR